jgi:hypothetical protein
VRKIAMPVPFNQPSPVLMQLLGWLTDAAKGVVTTSEEKIADVTSNAPVGTTQALIEQGAAVFSSIHSRLHDSQRRVFKILGRLNRWYLDEQRKNEIVEDLHVTADDFISNPDVIPVSDPHIFAESQRYAQIQTLAARAAANPDLYNRLAVEKRILKQIKLPDINEVLPDPQDVKDMNPALENVAMTIGKPVGAFPIQDQLAHMITHLDYFKDPMYGSNPIMAPTFVPAFLEHMKQHLTLWYLNQVDGYTSAALDRPFNVLKVEPIIQEAQKLVAAAGKHVHQDAQQIAQTIVPALQEALQMMQKMKSQQPPPPEIQAIVQTQMAETQRKTTYDQVDLQLRQQKQLDDKQSKEAKIVADEQMKAADITHDINVMTMEQQFEMAKAAQQEMAQQQAAAQQAQQAAAQQQAGAMANPMPQPPVQP